MLTHRNINIVLVLLVAVILLLKLPWWVFVLLFISYTAALVWGAMHISSGFFITVPCAAVTNDKVIALTFDDGPLDNYTSVILDILRQEQAPAAFFCIGKNIAGRESLLQRIDQEGHLVGNHSFTHHFWFDLFGTTKMLTEMQLVDTTVQTVIGKRPRLFRPPYGVTNPNLARAIKRGAYTPIGWNIRSLDTVAKDSNELFHRITAGLKPGAVVLLHDSMEITAQILPALITAIRQQGYRIERIDQLLNIPAYA